MLFIYYYLYISIFRAKKFNSIIFNNVKGDFFIDLNCFKTIKNVIVLDFINKRIIKIALNQMIIIDFIIPSFKIITRYKKNRAFRFIIKVRNKYYFKTR